MEWVAGLWCRQAVRMEMTQIGGFASYVKLLNL